jgi:hypothetical protein
MSTTNVLAIRINEVEPNPPGKDAGNEWIELYSENEFNLEGYYLQADNNIYNLSGSFSGYYSIQFSGLWIDNFNETVFLKNTEGIIDQTDVLTDSENNDKSWSLCNDEWILKVSTRDLDNGCEGEEINSEQEEVSENIKDNIKNKNIETDNNNETIEIAENQNIFVKITEKKKIILKNSKSEFNEEITPAHRTRISIIYIFVGLCVLLVVLMALRKL